MGGAGWPLDDVWWEVRVEPAGGGGYLSEFDVDEVCRGLPDGASVELVLAEFDDFSSSAAAFLARRLAGVRVRFRIAGSAWGAGSDFVSLFRRAEGQYLAVEASALERPA